MTSFLEKHVNLRFISLNQVQFFYFHLLRRSESRDLDRSRDLLRRGERSRSRSLTDERERRDDFFSGDR